MREHFPKHSECSGHLLDLNFSFDHNFLIRRFQGALRRDLIEDYFLFEAYWVVDSKPLASFIRSSVVFHVILFLLEYVTLNALKLADGVVHLLFGYFWAD